MKTIADIVAKNMTPAIALQTVWDRRNYYRAQQMRVEIDAIEIQVLQLDDRINEIEDQMS